MANLSRSQVAHSAQDQSLPDRSAQVPLPLELASADRLALEALADSRELVRQPELLQAVLSEDSLLQ